MSAPSFKVGDLIWLESWHHGELTYVPAHVERVTVESEIAYYSVRDANGHTHYRLIENQLTVLNYLSELAALRAHELHRAEAQRGKMLTETKLAALEDWNGWLEKHKEQQK